jgi:hypothetical protein
MQFLFRAPLSLPFSRSDSWKISNKRATQFPRPKYPPLPTGAAVPSSPCSCPDLLACTEEYSYCKTNKLSFEFVSTNLSILTSYQNVTTDKRIASPSQKPITLMLSQETNMMTQKCTLVQCWSTKPLSTKKSTRVTNWLRNYVTN